MSKSGVNRRSERRAWKQRRPNLILDMEDTPEELEFFAVTDDEEGSTLEASHVMPQAKSAR